MDNPWKKEPEQRIKVTVEHDIGIVTFIVILIVLGMFGVGPCTEKENQDKPQETEEAGE